MSPKVWLITGTSSGFGRVAAEHVLAQGDIVVATARTPEVLNDLKAKYGVDKLLTLKLDVTKPQEIVDVFQKAVDVFGRVDVVFNNAGFAVNGEVEGSPDKDVRLMFETNFWGATNVTREAVRVFREVNKPVGGRIIVTSSMAGLGPLPIIGYYCATKYALEGVTSTLANELDPEWNVKITLVEAGSFQTSGLANVITCPQHAAYTKPTLPTNVMREVFRTQGIPVSNSLEKGIGKIYQLSTLENPPLHLVLGNDAYEATRKQIALLTKEMNEYESWSQEIALAK